MKYAHQVQLDFNIILRFPDSKRAEKSWSYDDSVKVASFIAYANNCGLPVIDRLCTNLHSVCVELKH